MTDQNVERVWLTPAQLKTQKNTLSLRCSKVYEINNHLKSLGSVFKSRPGGDKYIKFQEILSILA